jgi:hypothetical protein
VLAYMGGWHAAMDDITYTPENFLPAVDPETNLPNGSVRTYGTWRGTSEHLENLLRLSFITT